MLHFAPSDARLRISVGEVHGHRHRNRVVVRVAEPLLGPQRPWSPVTGDIFSAIKMAISNRTIIFGINFFQVIYGFMEFLSRFLGFVVNFQGLQSCKIPTIGAPNMNRVSINQRIKDSVWGVSYTGEKGLYKTFILDRWLESHGFLLPIWRCNETRRSSPSTSLAAGVFGPTSFVRPRAPFIKHQPEKISTIKHIYNEASYNLSSSFSMKNTVSLKLRHTQFIPWFITIFPYLHGRLGYGISGMPGIPVDPTGSAHFGTWKASIGFTSSGASASA